MTVFKRKSGVSFEELRNILEVFWKKRHNTSSSHGLTFFFGG